MKLFSSVNLGDFTLRNRVVMAPMTRARADAQGVPSPLAVEYYGSRADILDVRRTSAAPGGSLPTEAAAADRCL